ncbi:ABC transporter permease [Kitasatospora sp. P5_F3]
MTTATATAPARPPYGGFNTVALRLEVRRVLRNRRTLVFALAMPALFFLSVGLPQAGQDAAGTGVRPLTMVNMAVYGSMLAATSCGAAVAVERSLGWTRQLRITPLLPLAHLAIKVLTAMLLGLLSVVVEFTLGAASGVRAPLRVWLLSGLIAWLGSSVFASLGLFAGFVLPSENVMQFIGPALALLALCGGLFVPLPYLPESVRSFAEFTPGYGVGQLARLPLTGGPAGGALANLAAWATVFLTGAAWLYRRDPAR